MKDKLYWNRRADSVSEEAQYQAKRGGANKDAAGCVALDVRKAFLKAVEDAGLMDEPAGCEHCPATGGGCGVCS